MSHHYPVSPSREARLIYPWRPQRARSAHNLLIFWRTEAKSIKMVRGSCYGKQRGKGLSENNPSKNNFILSGDGGMFCLVFWHFSLSWVHLKSCILQSWNRKVFDEAPEHSGSNLILQLLAAHHHHGLHTADILAFGSVFIGGIPEVAANASPLYLLVMK